MKYFLVFSLFLVALVYADSEAMKEELKAKMKECREEHGVTESQINDWKKSKESMTDDDKHKAACMATCVLKKLELMDGKELKMDAITAKAEELHADNAEEKAQMLKAINDCKDTVSAETDECEIGGKFVKCLFSNHSHHKHDSSEEHKAE